MTGAILQSQMPSFCPKVAKPTPNIPCHPWQRVLHPQSLPAQLWKPCPYQFIYSTLDCPNRRLYLQLI
jgi:hypothetical protein